METNMEVLPPSVLKLFKDHEGLWVWDEEDTRCRNIIAVHNTNLGPALGGIRRAHYRSSLAAFTDVARLSRGMTYKAALLGIKLGGGKSIQIPRSDAKRLREPQFLSMARRIESLNGRYWGGEDVGTSVTDVKAMRQITSYVGGVMEGHPYAGDPSPFTALGVFHALRAALYMATGTAEIFRRSIYIEGLGKVGMPLAELLHEEGAVLFVSNRMKEESERRAMERAKDEFRAMEVTLDEHGLPERFPDVLAYVPCALGGVVNASRIAAYPSFLKVIAGSANNVLLDPNRDGDLLVKRDILYAPDYVANNRGLWDIYNQMSGEAGYNAEKVRAGCKDNFGLVLEILERAEAENISPHRVADKMAEAIFIKKPV